MIEITCPTCQKPIDQCYDSTNGLTNIVCNTALLTDIEKSIKKHKIKDIIEFSHNMPQFSFLYAGTPAQSRAKIWKILCIRNKSLDHRGLAELQRDQITEAHNAIDARLQKEHDMTDERESAIVIAVDKVKEKFAKLAAA